MAGMHFTECRLVDIMCFAIFVELQPAYHQVDPSFPYRMNVPDSKQQEMLARQRCEEVQNIIC